MDQDVAGGELEIDPAEVGLAPVTVELGDPAELFEAAHEAEPVCTCRPMDLDLFTEAVSITLPSGVVVDLGETGDGPLRVNIHGPAGISEVVFDRLLREPVVVDQPPVAPEPVVVDQPPVAPEPVVVEQSAVAVEPQDQPYSEVGLAPSGDPADRPLMMQEEAGVYSLGPARFDLDGNGRNDAVIIEEQGLRTVAIDRDGDGWVDRVEIRDLATGAVGVFERQADRSWSPVTNASDPGVQAPVTNPVFVVPAEVAVEPLGPDAAVQAQVFQNMAQTVLGFVADFFPVAFPGEPWPLDESGRPYPAEVLLRMMTMENNENAEVRDAAMEVVNNLETARKKAFEQ